MERKVIHLNIADFGVAVERLLNSSLRQRPLILAQPASRAVVYDMSEEAYQDGVRKGMHLGLAQKRCQKAQVMRPRPAQYEKVMSECARHAFAFTPLVEQATGSGHLYLDVTGTHRLHGPAPDIGRRMRKTLRSDLGLDPIWSVAPNKLVAKVASRLVKPVGEYIVAEGEETSFLAPLPLTLLPGITSAELVKLRELNVSLASQAAALSLQDLSLICGQRSRFIFQAARGIDPTPVQPKSAPKNSLIFQYDFSIDTNEEKTIRASLLDLVRQAGYTLRKRNLGCRTVAVQLHYIDGIQVTRQAICKTVAIDDWTLERLAVTALYRGWHRRVCLGRLCLYCSRLTTPARQLSLFSLENKKQRNKKKISSSIDTIHELFGAAAVMRASQLPTPET